MKLANNCKRLLSAVLISVMLLGLLPATAFAADETINPGKAIDAAAFFSDLHTKKNDSNYKTAGTMSMMR